MESVIDDNTSTIFGTHDLVGDILLVLCNIAAIALVNWWLGKPLREKATSLCGSMFENADRNDVDTDDEGSGHDRLFQAEDGSDEAEAATAADGGQGENTEEGDDTAPLICCCRSFEQENDAWAVFEHYGAFGAQAGVWLGHA